MPDVIVIIHNIRSAHNVGSIFRTCEGFGVSSIILSGYSPYPKVHNDTRLPHIIDKVASQIHKTALGAETMVPYEYQPKIDVKTLSKNGYTIVGLEQDNKSTALDKYKPPRKIALLLGEEVDGISKELRDLCDNLIEIPMRGKKESFNVSVAAGIALYKLTTGV